MQSDDATMSSEENQGMGSHAKHKFSMNYILWNVRGGDFNATLASEERCSWRSTRGSDREFCSFVNDADLHDLGFVGPPFTWKRIGVESRLDRVLGSTTWQETFPDAVVKHLNWYKSDHQPLLLQLEGCAMMTRVDRPFRFLAHGC
ncbi:hypothetical protein K1719_017640 [Acacia pycnantha]|nr:hypothetical protein K1719_017640 [Acacia pycnantha]